MKKLDTIKIIMAMIIAVLTYGVMSGQMKFRSSSVFAAESEKAELEITKDMIGRYQIIRVNDTCDTNYMTLARLDTVTGKVCLMSVKNGSIYLKD